MRKLRFLFLGVALTVAAFEAVPVQAIPACTTSLPFTCKCNGVFRACTANAAACATLCGAANL
jgi:hypothetical protein